MNARIETYRLLNTKSPINHAAARSWLGSHLPVLVMPATMVVLWQAGSSLGLVHPAVLPGPLQAWTALLRIMSDGTLAVDFQMSLFRVVSGFAWGASAGLALGVLSGLSRLVERLVGSLVDAVRQVSTFAWIPLIVLWFGVGETSKTVIIAKAVFIPVYLNTFQGIRGVPNEYVEVAKILELGRWRFLRRVVIPGALPSIFTGIRLGAGFAWMAVVAAEMLGGLSGLGYALIRAKDFFESDTLFALIFVIGVVGLTADRLLRWMESYTLRWRRSYAGEER